MPCSNKVTTASGTFTAYNSQMSRCEAKKFCEKKNHILAPITNKADKDAVLKMLNPEECPMHGGKLTYHIGLDVSYCGESQERVFSNGVKYDDKIHGPLYTDASLPSDKCPFAYLVSVTNMNLVIGIKPGCNIQKTKVLCLDQTTAAASPLVQKKDDFYKFSSTNILIGVGAICTVFGCLVIATVKVYRYVRYLEKELNNPKN